MYYLYILECVDKTLYTGITVNLERRVNEHNTSQLGAKYTRARRPVKLVYSKKFRNRSLATKAEMKIKNLTKLKKLKLISSVIPTERRRERENPLTVLSVIFPKKI